MKKYTGEKTKLCMLYNNIDVPVGENMCIYGVDCEHQVVKKGKGEENELHILVAEVPKQLATEMLANKRARLYSEATK